MLSEDDCERIDHPLAAAAAGRHGRGHLVCRRTSCHAKGHDLLHRCHNTAHAHHRQHHDPDPGHRGDPQGRMTVQRLVFSGKVKAEVIIMELSASAVRAYRLHAHHLDHPVSLDAAAFCGFQNSPAGAWENAAFFRTGMDREALRQALADGRLLETWSFRRRAGRLPSGRRGHLS